MSDNDNAIPFSRLVEASGVSEDELLEKLAGILSKRPELPPELIDHSYRCPASGDPCDAMAEVERLRADPNRLPIEDIPEGYRIRHMYDRGPSWREADRWVCELWNPTGNFVSGASGPTPAAALADAARRIEG